MTTYALKMSNPLPTVTAFAVTDVSPDFHGKELAQLDDGTIKEIATGQAATGDYFVDTTGEFAANATFDALYAPKAEPVADAEPAPAPLA